MNKVKGFFNNFGLKQFCSIALAFLLVIGVTLTLSYTFSNNDIQVFNDYELVDQTLEEVSITDINIESETGIYTYKANVLGLKDTNIKYIRMVLKDSEDKEIVTLIGYIGEEIEKDEVKVLEASTDADISKLNSIDYEVIK